MSLFHVGWVDAEGIALTNESYVAIAESKEEAVQLVRKHLPAKFVKYQEKDGRPYLNGCPFGDEKQPRTLSVIEVSDGGVITV